MPPSIPPPPSSAREWDDNTVYDAPLQQRMGHGPWQEAEGEIPSSDGALEHSGARSSGLELDFDEETVRTTAPSEIAKRMREQIKRTKK